MRENRSVKSEHHNTAENEVLTFSRLARTHGCRQAAGRGRKDDQQARERGCRSRRCSQEAAACQEDHSSSNKQRTHRQARPRCAHTTVCQISLTAFRQDSGQCPTRGVCKLVCSHGFRWWLVLGSHGNFRHSRYKPRSAGRPGWSPNCVRAQRSSSSRARAVHPRTY